MKFNLRSQEGHTARVGKLSSENEAARFTEVECNKATRAGVYAFSIAVFAVAFALTMAAAFPLGGPFAVVLAVVVGFLFSYSVRVCPQWERVVVLRLGCLNRIAGPGLYLLIPFAEYTAIHVDQRIMTSAFTAEAALTADLVPVDVDAILFWMVWDPQKACMEVENYPKAVLRSAQTAMRDALGQVNLADLSMRRRQIDRDLQEVMSEKCEQWGITVMSVEIRDIFIPKELQGAMSKEAQAERERNARVILAEVEKDISEMYVEAAEVYGKNPDAIRLRAMGLAYEGAKDGKGILLMPSSLADSLDSSKLFK